MKKLLAVVFVGTVALGASSMATAACDHINQIQKFKHQKEVLETVISEKNPHAKSKFLNFLKEEGKWILLTLVGVAGLCGGDYLKDVKIKPKSYPTSETTLFNFVDYCIKKSLGEKEEVRQCITSMLFLVLPALLATSTVLGLHETLKKNEPIDDAMLVDAIKQEIAIIDAKIKSLEVGHASCAAPHFII